MEVFKNKIIVIPTSDIYTFVNGMLENLVGFGQ